MNLIFDARANDQIVVIMVQQGRILLVMQACIFILGRILDDLTWYDVGV